MKTASRVVDLVYADGACANARKATPGMGLKHRLSKKSAAKKNLTSSFRKSLTRRVRRFQNFASRESWVALRPNSSDLHGTFWLGQVASNR